MYESDREYQLFGSISGTKKDVIVAYTYQHRNEASNIHHAPDRRDPFRRSKGRVRTGRKPHHIATATWGRSRNFRSH